ncbi:MAG: hypothetical protein QM796_07310 [Chthoniobacteraceae bacterium]
MIVSTETNINYQRIEQAIKYLEDNFQRQPELDEVAEKVHLSPFHFQRTLYRLGRDSVQNGSFSLLTVDFLKSKLQESRNIVEAAESAGLLSQSSVYDLFITLQAATSGRVQNERKRHSG